MTSVAIFLRKRKLSADDNDPAYNKLRKLNTGEGKVLEIPRTSSVPVDLGRAMDIIKRFCAYDFPVDEKGRCTDSIIEAILSGICGHNIFPISVFQPFKIILPKASSYFKLVVPNEVFRMIALRHVPKGKERYVTGCFLSTSPSVAGLVKVAAKFGTDNFHWNVSPARLRAVLTYFIYDLRSIFVADYKFPYEAVTELPYNPSSSAGYPIYGISGNLKKKDIAALVRVHTKWAIDKIIIDPIEGYYRFPTFMYRFYPKAEVLDPDEDKGKVRVIGTVGPIGDNVSRLVSAPAMSHWARYRSCFIGVSIYSTLVYTSLKTMHHHEFMRIKVEFRDEDIKVRDPAKTAYIVLDLSGQDVSFTPLLLFITSWLRLFSSKYQNSTRADLEVLISLFVTEMGFANCKTVQWLDKMFYVFLGIMCSGYLMTSHIDTISLIFVIWLIITCILVDAGFRNPFSFWEFFDKMVYGDDTIMAVPLELIEYFGNDEGVPTILIAEFQKFGLTLKPKETRVYVPEPGHVDKFFTLIKDDEIVSSGVHFLQRYFVKYDEYLNPVHPDQPAQYILPWRPSNKIICKASIDPSNWESFGTEIYAAAFAKAFGLIMDAGPNKTMHIFLRNIMKEYLRLDPDADYKARFLSSTGFFSDVLKKFGHFDQTFLVEFRKMSYEESYFWVCNHITLGPFAHLYKNPATDVTDYREFLTPQFVSKYYSPGSAHGSEKLSTNRVVLYNLHNKNKINK